MIPKIINYCWFGRNNKPESVLKCISSWRKYLPDYEIFEWNEDNYNIENSILYVKQAYDSKKWAFVSDYVRLYALYNYGGLYFDTDVEVFKPFDDLLDNRGFCGFESKDYIGTSVLGFEKKCPFLEKFINAYADRDFIDEKGIPNIHETNVIILTQVLEKQGLKRNGQTQCVNGVMIYPQHFFSSNDFCNIFNHYRNGIYSYHHFSSSWYEKKSVKGLNSKLKHYIIGILRNTIGTDILLSIKHGKK